MPLRQVYGKKRGARAGRYDPDAIFGSLRCSHSSPIEVKVAEVAEEIAGLNISDASRESQNWTGQKASVLRALDGNSLPRVKANAQPSDHLRARARRICIAEDTSEEKLPSTEDTSDAEESHIRPNMPKRECEQQAVPRKSSSSNSPTFLAIESAQGKKNKGSFDDLLALSSHDLTNFEDWANQLSDHFHLTKIAEASFGEVYRLSLLHDLPGFSKSDESVLKVIPLRPDESYIAFDKRKREAMAKKVADMSRPADVANEVKLLQRMSTIPGFTNFRDVHIIQGRPPLLFQGAYEAFNVSQKARHKEQSHFPDPKKKSSYEIDQLWAVIEMQDAGTDLERLMETGACGSIFSIWDMFWQVAISVAKGEEGAQFEHRDLHLGNICISGSTTARRLDSTDWKTRKLHFTSLETTIIDYTLSRAELTNGETAFHDLASSENAGIFTGDSTTEYQYDIYRYMRGAVLRDDVYADFSTPAPVLADRSWEQFHPITNLIWLHYLLYKLLEHLSWPSEEKAPPRRLKLAYAQWKRAIDLEHILLRVQDLLDPGRLGIQEGLASVGDLVGLALGECWLDMEEVIGEGQAGEDESHFLQPEDDPESG